MARGRACLQSIVVVIAVSVFLAGGSTAPAEEDASPEVFVIAAGADDLPVLLADQSTVEVFENAPGNGAIRWTCPGGGAMAMLSANRVPEDLREYRLLRFRIRAEGTFDAQIHVCFTGGEGVLQGLAPAPKGEWAPVEIPLPGMFSRFGFDPSAVIWFSLCVYAPPSFEIELDDLELVKAGSGWRYSEEEEAIRLGSMRFPVADFETPPQIHAIGAKLDRVPGEGKDAGTVLRWTHAPSPEGGGFQLTGLPEDIRPYRELRFRARVLSGRPELVSVCIRSAEGGLDGLLSGLGPNWREVVLFLPEMAVVEPFAPEAAICLEIVAYDSSPFVAELDDIVLLKAGAGYRYSAGERRELRIDTTAPSYRIADFERRNSLSLLCAVGGAVEVFTIGKGRNVPHALRWRVDGGTERRFLTILTVPEDIRDYRYVRLRARAEKAGDQPLLFYFASAKGTLGSYHGKLTTRWQNLSLPLPEMVCTDGFDPERVMAFGLACEGSKPFVLEIDDVELVKEAGGWKRTESVQIEEVFGAERARKVKASESAHFRVWTDSAAAGKEFPRAMEKIFEFVRGELGLGEIEDKIAVYIFQNSDLYFDFCVRQGWSRSEAQATAGHAARSYFATYYQSADSFILAHELTHCIVDRVLGDGGGSWFAEGVAVYIEYRWQKKSPAEEFAGRLRSDQYVGLGEFFEIPCLAAESDVKGGPRSAQWLYPQAGAFFEFILRGPLSKSAREIIAALAVLDLKKGGHLAEIERIFGLPIPELEKAWLAWGREPPRRKK